MPSSRHFLALLAALVLSSCSTYRETVVIHFSSDPSGADVVVNGVPTGFSTPCMVSLPKERQLISIEKEGFQIPQRILFPDPYKDTWFYSEGTVGVHTFDFPTFVNLDDFLQPVVTKNELIPARIFVRLKRLSNVAPKTDE